MKARLLALPLLIGLLWVPPGLASAADPRAAGAVPELVGPIANTATSHMFDVSTVDLATHGYLEEEFFQKGTGNVYDYDSAGKVVTVTAGAPYENRIIVRRPADRRAFSGTVVVELMNMTNGWDLDKMWLSSHDEYMRDGDVYVGVTSAPNTVAALKRFDPARYAALSWADPRPPGARCAGTAVNSGADTEGGLIWDIFSQVGAAFESGGRNNPLHGWRVEKVYATGYSQSGGYLTRYINAIHPRARVYDGFLSGTSVVAPPLNKCATAIATADPRNTVQPTAEPVITVMSQTDFYNLGGYQHRRPDANTRTDRYRLYEVPGASHASQYTAGFQPSAEDLARAGFTYTYYNCTDPGLSNDFPMQYIFDATLVNLDLWVRHGTPPPTADRIQVADAGTPSAHTVLDQYGNAVGGVRTPWLDEPTATYYPSSTPGFGCSLAGHRVPLTTAQLRAIYPDHGGYARAVMAETNRLVAQRWLTRADADAVINEAASASIPL